MWRWNKCNESGNKERKKFENYNLKEMVIIKNAFVWIKTLILTSVNSWEPSAAWFLVYANSFYLLLLIWKFSTKVFIPWK